MVLQTYVEQLHIRRNALGVAGLCRRTSVAKGLLMNRDWEGGYRIYLGTEKGSNPPWVMGGHHNLEMM